MNAVTGSGGTAMSPVVMSPRTPGVRLKVEQASYAYAATIPASSSVALSSCPPRRPRK